MAQSILLVEDNPSDCLFTRLAWEEAGNPGSIVECGDCGSALLLLQGMIDQPERPRPDLILLDLNLPGCNGKQILKFVREHAPLAAIPVVVMTTSSAPRDMQECMQLGANGYLVKAARFEEFIQSMRELRPYLQRS